MKTGADHLKSLDDGRAVYLNGQLLADPVNHPAFRNAARTIAGLYDFQAANPELTTFVSPTSGKRVNKCWRLPRSYDDLVDGRKALAALARTHFGFMGRSPDHIAYSVCGQVMGIEIFKRASEERAKAIESYFEFARDNDLYIASAFVNPQADRSKATSELQEDADLALAVVDEDSQGVTVRGAKMLGTACAIANEALISHIQPLKPGEERFALSFAQPLGAKGVSILSRRSYEESATSEFDYPLSSRFDENDAIIHFNEVKVPWERVFIYRDIGLSAAQYHGTPAHVYQNYQCQIRLVVKLRFLLGITKRIAETNGIIGIPQVRDTMGRLAALASMVEGMVHGMESNGRDWYGYYIPDEHLTYSVQVITQEMYPKIVNAIRELAGGGLIMLPSSADDFGHPEMSALIHKTQKSPATDSTGRVKADEARLGRVGLRVRISARSIRDVLCRGAPYSARTHVPDVRLGQRNRPGRQSPRELRPRGLARSIRIRLTDPAPDRIARFSSRASTAVACRHRHAGCRRRGAIRRSD